MKSWKSDSNTLMFWRNSSEFGLFSKNSFFFLKVLLPKKRKKKDSKSEQKRTEKTETQEAMKRL